MKQRSIEMKVGLLVFIALAVLVAFVLLLGDFHFSKTFRLFVDYSTTAELKAGAPVKAAGVAAGKVESIAYRGGQWDPLVRRHVRVRVELSLDPDIAATLHQDARFYITTQGLLGEKYLEIDPGSPQAANVMADAAYEGVEPLRLEIMGTHLAQLVTTMTMFLQRNAERLDDLVDSATQVAKDLSSFIRQHRERLGQVVEHLDHLMAEGDAAMADAREVLASTRAALGDGQMIRKAVEHVESIAGTVRGQVPSMLDQVRSFLTRYENLGQSLETVAGEGRRYLQGISDQAGDLLRRIGQILENIRQGKGSLGGLLMDAELYEDIRELLKDLKLNPWKFLWKQ